MQDRQKLCVSVIKDEIYYKYIYSGGKCLMVWEI